MLNLIHRSWRYESLSPAERSILKFFWGMTQTALIAGVYAGVQFIGQGGKITNWQIVWAATLGAFVKSLIDTGGKYITASGGPPVTGLRNDPVTAVPPVIISLPATLLPLNTEVPPTVPNTPPPLAPVPIAAPATLLDQGSPTSYHTRVVTDSPTLLRPSTWLNDTSDPGLFVIPDHLKYPPSHDTVLTTVLAPPITPPIVAPAPVLLVTIPDAPPASAPVESAQSVYGDQPSDPIA